VRQPVAQISSSVELVQLLSNHDDRLKPYVVSASEAAEHVWNLVERASRATDAEAFVRQSQPQWIDLNHLLAELIASYRQIYSGVDFQVQSIASIYVHADPTLIKEAVGNLLVNSASFAHENSAVQVALDRSGTHVIIRVRNKGPTLQGNGEELFGLFSSTRSDPTSEHQGLGLYLVRLVAEHYGGSATICDLGDRSGVEASIVLPLPISASRTTGSSER
jgi:two-component system, OmpR family, sensor histidine kinase ChvG